jgi:clathrin heavy chain
VQTESVELARPALAQGRSQLIEKWLKVRVAASACRRTVSLLCRRVNGGACRFAPQEDKIECSSELGDMTKPYSLQLALAIYLRSGDSHKKVVNCFLQTGEYGKVVPYCQQNRFTPNFGVILQSLIAAGNAKAAQDMASQLVKNESGPMIEINVVADLFTQYSRLQECTSFLLDVLAGDKPEQGYLQTRLLEMNLMGGATAVVDTILDHGMFHHFDKAYIAKLYEKVGLFQRAMELYTDMSDIKRCIVRTNALTPEFLVSFFGNLNTSGGCRRGGAVLCCAVLCCAVLCCAVLCCAVLCCAVLCCAVLCCAVLCCASVFSWH